MDIAVLSAMARRGEMYHWPSTELMICINIDNNHKLHATEALRLSSEDSTGRFFRDILFRDRIFGWRKRILGGRGVSKWRKVDVAVIGCGQEVWRWEVEQ
jgi:hypothetical protein